MPRKFTFTTQVYDKTTDFPATGDVDVIYVDASKNTAYRYDDSYYAISSEGVEVWGALGSLSKGGGGGGASWGSISGTLSSQTDLQTALNAKQNTLVSATNIKTINSTSLLGSGDVSVQPTLVSATNIKTINGNSVLGSGDLVVSGGGSGGGIHLQRNLPSGAFGHLFITYAAFQTQNSTANRLILMPFIPNQSLTIQNLSVNCTLLAVGGLAKILIYSDVSGTPTTKLYESANLDTSTTGIKTASTTFNFVAGTTYWLSFICNNSTNIFNFYGQTALLQFSGGSFGSATHCLLNTTFASIPNTLPSVNFSSGNVPAIQIQRA